MTNMRGVVLLLLFVVGSRCLFENIKFGFCSGDLNVGCLESERKVLLEFKKGLKDPMKRLSTWSVDDDGDCCKWQGVVCNNTTSHVVKLDLRNPYSSEYDEGFEERSLGGKIIPCLLGLRYLTHLDLSLNYFEPPYIPKFMGSFERLTYLNLSYMEFIGTIPRELGNLSSLRHLDLSRNELAGTIPRELGNLSSLRHLDLSRNYVLAGMIPRELGNLPNLRYLDLCTNELAGMIPRELGNLSSLRYLDLYLNHLAVDNLQWLAHLSFLQHLDMGYVNLTMVSHSWAQVINSLPSLSRLELSNCGLQSIPLSLPAMNFTALEVLDLSWNDIESKIPDWLSNIGGLVNLDVRGNKFQGPIPTNFGSLSSLEELYLSFNELNGTIPESFGQLSKLQTLELSYTSLVGVISEIHFANLTRLEVFDISFNSLVLNVSSHWVPPFQIKDLQMKSFRLGPQFPAWLRTQKNVTFLSLSNGSISDTIPNWFWGFSSQLEILYLDHNQIHGQVPNSLNFPNAKFIDVSFNHLEGPLPIVFFNVIGVDLSHNSFSGSIPPSFGEKSSNLSYLSLSNNRINGTIPLSIYKMKTLEVLDLSQNHLWGNLPRSVGNLKSLVVLNLANNNLHGEVPTPIGNLDSLQSIHLNNNNLFGKIPSFLKNCRDLKTLDLGDNGFSGNIPAWIGESLSDLMILRLRGNLFTGTVPLTLSYLSSLQILDLAYNKLSGPIPQSFGNLSAMAVVKERIGFYWNGTTAYNYKESLVVALKGRSFEYSRAPLSLVISIDLSSNNLSSEIPESLANLSGIVALNLSRNHLTGNIPRMIGNLRLLESLDISRNQLCGEIPQNLSELSFLSVLDLSQNNLSGKIPTGNQLQTLANASIYSGNPYLCGPPLLKQCPKDESYIIGSPAGPIFTARDGDWLEDPWFCASVGLGFAIGLSGFFAVLLLKRSWSAAYYRFVDGFIERLLWIGTMILLKVVNHCSFFNANHAPCGT